MEVPCWKVVAAADLGLSTEGIGLLQVVTIDPNPENQRLSRMKTNGWFRCISYTVVKVNGATPKSWLSKGL